jgi:hypothetical protein
MIYGRSDSTALLRSCSIIELCRRRPSCVLDVPAGDTEKMAIRARIVDANTGNRDDAADRPLSRLLRLTIG